MTSIYLVDNGGIGLSNNSGETVVHPTVYYGGAFTKNIYKYIYNGSYAIAIGTSTILKSSNPTSSGSWSEQSQSVLAPYTYSNANTSGEEFCILGWNGEYWLTITSAGKVLKSTDGTIWNLIGNTNSSLRPGDHSTRNKSNLLWTGTFWIYASSSSSTHCFFKSEDGVTWTGLSNNTLLSATSIVYNGSYYIAFGTRNPSGLNSEIVKSTDCITWTAATITGVTFTSEMVAWNGSYWLGVGYHSEGRGVIKSTDGTNWVSPTNVNLRDCIAWDGTNWISLHNDMTTIYRSSDGSNWTAGDQYGLSTYLIVNPTTQPILSFGSPPEAPTGVTAVAGNGQVTVSWSAPASNGSSAITGYTVTPSSGSAVTVGNVLTTTITGLANGTPLTFTVVATNSAGSSSASSASSSVTPSDLGAPTGVTAVAGNGHVTVSWTAPASNGGSAITGYTVTPSSGSAVTVGNILTTTIIGLANGTPVTFTVVATNSAGSSSASSAASSSVTPVAAPGAPSEVTVTAVAGNNGQVRVSWTAPASNGDSAITGYTVISSSGISVTVGNLLTIAVIGLTYGTPVTFRVVARNSNGTSPVSSASSSVTPFAAASVPSEFRMVPGDGKVTLSWSAPQTSGVTGYLIRPSLEWIPWKVVDNVLSTVFTDLPNEVPVAFIIAAKYGDYGAFSDWSDDVTPSSTLAENIGPFSAPRAVTAVARNNHVTVSWDAPASNGGSAITGYTVTPSSGSAVTVGNVLRTTITGLANGTPVTFTVVAINSAGTSPASSPSSSVTPVALEAPTGVTALAGNGHVTVSWTAPASNGGSAITGYTVTPSSGSAVTVGNVLTTTITGLANGTPVTFTVVATNSNGSSSASSPSSSVTPSVTLDALYVPRNLVASTIFAPSGTTYVSIRLTWDGANGNLGIGYGVRNANTGQILGYGDNTVREFNHASFGDLLPNTTYTFELWQRVSGNNNWIEQNSKSITITTGNAIPSTPTNITAVAGNGQVTLSWSGSQSNGLTGYVIRPSLEGIAWKHVGNVLSTVFTDLPNGTPVQFSIAPKNDTGVGEYSTFSDAVTPSSSLTNLSVPGAPTGVTAVAGNGQVTVSWSAPASNGGSAITGYTVTPSSGSAVTVGNVLTTTITGLANGTPLTFTVVATNSAGSSSASSASSSVTPVAAVSAPGAPTGVTAVAGNGQVTVSWSAPASNGGSTITAYTVTPSSGSAVTVGNVLTTTITGLANGTPITFTVVATNSAGTSSASSASSSVTPVAAPGAPTGVTVSAGVNSVTISWSAPANTGGSAITGYIVTPSSGSIVTVGNVLTTTITGLAAGTSLTFTVSASNTAGNSAASAASASVTPRGPGLSVPSAVIGVTGVAGPASATISWSAPVSDGGSAITGYKLICDPDNKGGVLNLAGPTARSLTIAKGIKNAVPTTYSVVAINAVGQSDSIKLISYPLPGAPKIASALRGASGVINLVWTAKPGHVASPITGYLVAVASTSPSPAPGTMVIPTPTVTATGGSVSISGLTNGSSYIFSVKSVSDIGQSLALGLSKPTIAATTPSIPTSFTGTKAVASAILNWVAPTNTGGLPIIGYNISYTLAGVAKIVLIKAPATTGIIKGLVNGTAYSFTIQSITLAGASPQSAAVTVTPGLGA